MKKKHVYPDEQERLYCPYCGDEIQEWWKYFEQSEGNTEEKIECPSCKRAFDCEVFWYPRFTTYRYVKEGEE